MDRTKKLIVFGAGRMGLSHAAMAGLIDPDLKTSFIEPNTKTRAIFGLLLGNGVKFQKAADERSISEATHAIIATPPQFHLSNLQYLSASGFQGRLLIEKPISVKAADLNGFDEVMSGYVLRHGYFWTRMRERTQGQTIRKLTIHLETNQDFAVEAAGWRVQEKVPGLSLLSEFGSHCVNLLLDLVPPQDLSLTHVDVNRVHIETGGDEKYEIILDANSTNVRKSTYVVKVETDAARYETDFYSFAETALDGSSSNVSTLAEEGVNVPAYLRGQEFTQQMLVFLGDAPLDDKDIQDAVQTDILLDGLMEVMKCRN